MSHSAVLASSSLDVRADLLEMLIKIEAEERRLVVAFDLRRRAVAATGREKERAALTSFLNTTLLPFLTSSLPLYNAVDSLSGGGYATSAALIDQYLIDDHVSYLTALPVDQSAAFDAGISPLAALLESYFAKQRQLVRPILERHLRSQDGLRLVAHR